MTGILYLVATPIGNLEDISLRALRVLREADLIAAEDTRISRRLLSHFQISKPLVSYYEHNKRLREGYLLQQLLQGKNVALISDAGTPALSDPGADLARAAVEAGAEVIAIPGASALLTALTVSGLDTGSFVFCGFAPRQKCSRRQYLQALAGEERTMVFYEAPHRLLALLQDMEQIFGPERPAAACRELTKLHEEKRRASLSQLCAHFSQTEPRGEFVLVLAGAQPAPAQEIAEADLASELGELLKQGLSRRQAAKQLALKYDKKAGDIYSLGLDVDF